MNFPKHFEINWPQRIVMVPRPIWKKNSKFVALTVTSAIFLELENVAIDVETIFNIKWEWRRKRSLWIDDETMEAHHFDELWPFDQLRSRLKTSVPMHESTKMQKLDANDVFRFFYCIFSTWVMVAFEKCRQGYASRLSKCCVECDIVFVFVLKTFRIWWRWLPCARRCEIGNQKNVNLFGNLK